MVKKKKKKDSDITLIQCSVAAQRRMKAQAKKEGGFLYRLTDKAFNSYCNSKKGETY